MVNPIYKWTLAVNGGQETQVYPVYKDDLAKEYELETNQEFYRAKLSGKLTFVGDDYDFIASQSFDTQFGIKIYISYDAGQTWAEYWAGNFWKTNCTFNADDRNVTFTPDVVDRYNDVLAGMEKEYNLIDLAPEIAPVQLDKRPMIQMYVPGQSVIGCFLSGMYWEQECEPESDTAKLTQVGDGKLNFAFNRATRVVDVTQQGTPEIADVFRGDPYSDVGTQDYINGAYKFEHFRTDVGAAAEYFYIKRVSDDQIMWWVGFVNQAPKTYPIELTLQPYEGSGATGDVKIYIHDIEVYARYICDTPVFGGVGTYTIPDDDIVENNRNYLRVIGYYFPDTVFFTANLSETPTPWGLYQPGKYYEQPSGSWYFGEFYPVSRNAWGRISIWFAFFAFDWIIEQQGRQEYTLRDAFPLASVISVLLAQVAPNLTHLETTDYSKFLYGTNPLLGITQRILITPKSNMISLGYDQPAQKAPITLKRVLDMLRDCFRCYWFIDDQNRFCIEHISYFRNGGTYEPGEPNIGRDLTVERVTRNGKKWAFGTSEYKFDKPEMAARYQFGWMDDVTQLFEGNPLEIVSKYVNPENIEQIDVSQFTSDVDYILLNPGEISKDGFVLLSTIAILVLAELKYADFTVQGLLKQDGTLGNTSSRWWQTTDYVEIPTGTKIIHYLSCYPINNGYCGLVLYDANKNFVAYIGSTVGYDEGRVDITQYANAKYLRASTEGRTNVYVKFEYENIKYKLPYVNFDLDGVDHYLQNAYVAFIFLQQYYFWDMPALYFKYNGEQMVAQGVKRLKTQTLKFPAYTDPNTTQLIKTLLGNGTIQKMSVNLLSRNAQTTLKYDTEQ